MASQTDDSITHFTRAPGGALTFAGCIADNGQSGCVDPPNDPLVGAGSVAVSPDGGSVYVPALGDDSITHFTRAPGGALTFESCIAEAGGAGCVDPPIDSLDGAIGVAVSSDAASVYVASPADDAITHFTRAPGGALTFESCIAELGLSGCADPPIDSLDFAFAPAVSPDGASVYVVSVTDGSITNFTRAFGGSLAFASCVAEAGASGCVDPPIDSLDDATALALSPDGESVYVAAIVDNSVTHFTRVNDVDPPETTIAKGPKPRTSKRKAKFKFGSDEPGSTFQCKVKGKARKAVQRWHACDSPQRYAKRDLKPGKHGFKVRATDEAGNIDPTPAKHNWKIQPGASS